MQSKMKYVVGGSIANALLLAPMLVFAQGLSGGISIAGTAQNGLIPAILNLLSYFLILAAVIAAIYIIFGGVKYIISQGDESAAEEAKSTIVYAVIGLVVIGLAAALVNFIIQGVQRT